MASCVLHACWQLGASWLVLLPADVHLSLHMCVQLDAINDAFVEARDEIEYAQEVHIDSHSSMHVLYQMSALFNIPERLGPGQTA